MRLVAAIGAVLLAAGSAVAADAPLSDAKILKRVQSSYPPQAAQKRVEGCVRVGLDVRADGLADHYVILDSKPAGVFDRVSLKALNGWRWEKGKPGHLEQVIQYQMEKTGEHDTAPSCAAPVAAVRRELQVYQSVMPEFDPGTIGDGGCVTLGFVIKHDGFVGDIKVLEARPGSLAAASIAALKQWQFQSFPPPDVYAVQTFNFTPEQVRLPDNAVRSSLAVMSEAGALKGTGCGVVHTGAAK